MERRRNGYPKNFLVQPVSIYPFPIWQTSTIAIIIVLGSPYRSYHQSLIPSFKPAEPVLSLALCMVSTDYRIVLLDEIWRDSSLELHMGCPPAVILDSYVRAHFVINSQEAAAEEINGLSEFLRILEAAARSCRLAMGDESGVRLEDFEAGGTADALNGVFVSDMHGVVAGGGEGEPIKKNC
jgi:hypothetical protein